MWDSAYFYVAFSYVLAYFTGYLFINKMSKKHILC